MMRRALVLSALLLCLVGASRLMAAGEEGAEGPVAEAAAEGESTASAAAEKKPPETLWEMIVAGGPMNLVFMGCLGLFSLFGAAVILERLVNLTRGKVLPAEFVRELSGLIERNDTRREAYLNLSQRFTAPAADILKAGLLRVGRPMLEIEKSMEDAAAREMAGQRAKIRPLSVVGNVAPLVGLLGTVVGMLGAFRTASQEGLGKAEILAEGIYLALETTVAGLVIAIPCMLFAAMFIARVERYMRETDETLMEVMPVLARMSPESTAGSAPRSASTAASNPLMAS